jgi:hypothetical protein
MGRYIVSQGGNVEENKFLLKDTFLSKTQGGIYLVCESLENRRGLCLVYTKEREQVCRQVLTSVA